MRKPWSDCGPDQGFCSGGGSGPAHDHRVQDPTKALVTVLALCSRPGGCPTQCCRTEGRTRETRRCVTGFVFRSPPQGLTQSGHWFRVTGARCELAVGESPSVDEVMDDLEVANVLGEEGHS